MGGYRPFFALQRRVVVAVLLTVQILLHEILVCHPFRVVIGCETIHNALLALLGIETDGDDDGFGGHIFAGF